MNLNDTLPDLMRRATEDIEPASPDLVARGIRRGKTLRRRRTALASLSGATAVLAAVGLVVAGTHSVSDQGAGPTQFAGPPTATATTAGKPPATPSAKPTTRPPATFQGTLRTLRELLPAGTKVTKPELFGDNFMQASYLADDGKGPSHVEALVWTEKEEIACPPEHPEFCSTRRDGTLVIASHMDGRGKFADINYVTISHPDGRTISVGSAGGTGDHAKPTRKPLLSVAQLIKIADNPAWSYPPLGWGKDLNR